jgi:polar amino acid transport system substrate-binding protein
MMRPVRFALALAALLALGLPLGSAGAQTFPNHVDPNAREDMTDTNTVPALRFLTTADFPPFNYRDGNGEVVGFNIDLARAICQRLSARCTVQDWPWEMAQEALADNQGDALIAGVAITPEAGARFDFSRIYLELPARFVTATDAAQSFAPAQLNGEVAVREGSAHAAFLTRYLPGIEQRGFDTEIAALNAVAENEVVAYFGDAMRASFWLNENSDCCAFAGEPYFRPDLFGPGLAIALPAGLDRVRVAINWALIRLQREGRLDELYLRWFPVSFY